MNKREELARQAFKEGYNCSQAMVAAFSDLMEMDKKTALLFTQTLLPEPV